MTIVGSDEVALDLISASSNDIRKGKTVPESTSKAPQRRIPIRGGRGLVALLSVAVFVAAIGSVVATGASASSSGNGVATAKKLVAQESAKDTWTTPGPAISVGHTLKGKKVYFLANGITFPFVVDMVGGVKEAAALLGMKVLTGDGAGSSATAARLVEQATAEKVSAIIDEGFPDSQISAPLKAAKAAGIKVIEFGAGKPSLPTSTESANGVSALATFCYPCAGAAMADLAIAQSNGHADAAIVAVPGISVSPGMTQAIEKEIHKLCSACKVTVIYAPLADWSTQLASDTSSAIRRDPKLNYLLPLFDAMFSYMGPAIVQAGATSRVHMISYNATSPGVTDLSKGNQNVTGDVGGAPAWVGWAAIDQVARLLTGQKPLASEDIPNRTFTPQNVKTLNLKASDDTWYGINFAAQYRKLWGFG